MFSNLEEVKRAIHNGVVLNCILTEILQSPNLLRDHGNPFEVLYNAGYALNPDKDCEYLDMTTSEWLNLKVETQIEYAKAYQEWYVKGLKQEIEKNFAVGKTEIAMRLIPPGKFLMGSPLVEIGRYDNETQHKVIISKAFWCGKYEVTQKQWRAVMGNNPSKFKGDNLPVEMVSWEDCDNFCKKSGGMKLLSEAQWEYACRAGTTNVFNLGSNINTDQVNYDGNYPYNDTPKGEYRKKTVVCGSLPNSNTYGLYDMHGNVYEYCQDAYQVEYPSEETDPVNLKSSSDRVYRGGSWLSFAGTCRCANRGRYAWGFSILGLRVCRLYP